MSEALDRFVAEREQDWVLQRRAFHREPELGFTEVRTAATLAARLAELGFEVRAGEAVMRPEAMLGVPSADQIRERLAAVRAEERLRPWAQAMDAGCTGLVAELRRGAGPVTALRFDIDALPVRECAESDHRPAREGFASTRPGLMHSCGHDGHAAIGLGVAEWLAHPGSGWRGTVRLVFQPAEEGGRGAFPMAEAGVVDDADWLFAAHLGCGLATGEVAAAGVEMLWSTKLDAVFHGRAAHAAGNPQDGRNALLAGATASLNLHALPRYQGATTRFNVGRMDAGTGRNVIPDRCHLQLEVRGETEAAAAWLEDRAREILDAAARMHACGLEVEVMGRTASAPCDSAATAIVSAAATDTPGIHRVIPEYSIGGGEDAPYLMRRVQAGGGAATYFLIGSDLADCHHSVRFDFDERSIALGVRLFASIVERASAGPPTRVHRGPTPQDPDVGAA
jgi:aminobenzoyl-glutamate utilization protein A